MLDVLVTMRFNEAQLERLRRASPDLRVTCADTARADYAAADVLYAGAPPRDLGQAPRLKWVQLHMAGVNALHDHPLYTTSAIPLTTTSGVHAATIAEYAITVLLALAHRVPRMVEWQARMKPNAYFINVGRGASVDEAALARALAERRIAGAAVDVFADEPPPPGHPLYRVDNVIVSPHVSGFLPSYDDRCAELFAENLRRYLAGAPLLNLVDRARGY